MTDAKHLSKRTQRFFQLADRLCGHRRVFADHGAGPLGLPRYQPAGVSLCHPEPAV